MGLSLIYIFLLIFGLYIIGINNAGSPYTSGQGIPSSNNLSLVLGPLTAKICLGFSLSIESAEIKPLPPKQLHLNLPFEVLNLYTLNTLYNNNFYVPN